MPTDSEIILLLACLLFVPLLPFVTAPFRLRFNAWQPADPVYAPADEDALPPGARRLVAELREMGFESRGTWRLARSSHATGRVVLLEHPRALDVAKVVVVKAGRRPASLSLAFQTRFEDGTEAVTANHRAATNFPQPPEVASAWLPEVRDPAALYRVHDQFRDAVGGARKRVGVGDAAGFLHAGSARAHARWVSTGYYALDESRGVYRPTWKGAVLIAWRLLWPLKPVFQARRRRASHQLLRRLGVSVE
jgi:hypothetical protein